MYGYTCVCIYIFIIIYNYLFLMIIICNCSNTVTVVYALRTLSFSVCSIYSGFPVYSLYLPLICMLVSMPLHYFIQLTGSSCYVMCLWHILFAMTFNTIFVVHITDGVGRPYFHVNICVFPRN